MDNIKSKSPQLSKKNIKCSSHPTKKECDKYDCLWGKTGKCSKKRISKKTKVVKEPKPIEEKKTKLVNELKETELKCPSHKTQEVCEQYDCLWGKTGKCSKKRISKKTKEVNEPKEPKPKEVKPKELKPKEVKPKGLKPKELKEPKPKEVKEPKELKEPKPNEVNEPKQTEVVLQPKEVKPKEVKEMKVSNPNKDLIRELYVLLDEAKLGSSANDKFRVKSYRKAIEKISLMTTKIVQESDIPLTKGGNIYLKVKEFLENGNIGRTQEILAVMGNTLDVYRDLQKIAELGPVKAKELVEKHGIQSIDELKQRQELLNDKQKIGLKYYETFDLRIPRTEVKKHEKIYETVIKLNTSLNGLTFSINGSYRREMKDSGDIDILLSHPENNVKCFRVFVDALLDQGYLIDTLAYGNKKYMGYGKLLAGDSIARRIDIIYCPPNEYPFAQLYFTGSGAFNVRMREYATSKGYKLNEKGLIDLKTNEFVKHSFEKEDDIFQYLGLSYVEPSKRIETYKF